MILNEEAEEAQFAQVWLGIGAVVGGVFEMAAAEAVIGGDYRQTPVAVGCALAIGACSYGIARCRRTIRAYRDQKRLELIQRELTRE